MNMPLLPDDELDRIARDLHANAVRRVEPSTLRHVHPAPAMSGRAARRGGRAGFAGWALASACAAAVAAIAVVGPMDPGTDRSPYSDRTAAFVASADVPSTSVASSDALLDEDPDFYLWLATTDVQPIAME